VLVPGLVVLVLLLAPYLDPKPRGVGVWLSPERRLANAIFGVAAAAAVLLTLIGMFFRGPNWRWIWPWTG
jgi:quinol-cytochrome oxidoreductase complex cytochrome b subunit